MLLRESVWKLSKLRAAVLWLLLVSACAISARPETAAFDLIGPKVDVRVQRGGKTLPIAEVPNLQAGDRVWVHPDLPDSQSVRYLMVIVFLRGATNPPPENWFTRVETWNKAVRQEGVYIAVPDEAEEAIVLLAPETGGAFNTLRVAVRGKPGAFVRATQDLLQASLDRARLDKYLDAVRETSGDEVNSLMEEASRSNRLRGILGINKAPTVSVDFNHDPHSSTFDVTQTQVVDKRFVRVLSWYDNEWGFSNRMVEIAAYFGGLT